MVEVLHIALPGHPENDNQRRKWHWSRRSEFDSRWKGGAKLAALAAKPASCPWQRVDIEVIFIKPTRAGRDPDNVVGAAKPIIDGLVFAGIIPDDSDRYVHRVCGGVEYEKGVREVRIMVTLLEEDP